MTAIGDKKMRIKQFSLILIVFWLAVTQLSAQDRVRRLTQEEALKAAVTKPQPEYPAVARQLKIQGRIDVEISIDTSGAVDGVKVISGNSALTGGTVNTLKRWRFSPILSDGAPVRAVAVLSFLFHQ
jgi:protein TonB